MGPVREGLEGGFVKAALGAAKSWMARRINRMRSPGGGGVGGSDYRSSAGALVAVRAFMRRSIWHERPAIAFLVNGGALKRLNAAAVVEGVSDGAVGCGLDLDVRVLGPIPLSGLGPVAGSAIVLARLFVAFQEAAGARPRFVRAAEVLDSGDVWIVSEHMGLPIVASSFDESLSAVLAASSGIDLEMPERVRRLRALEATRSCGRWMEALTIEAERRGIPHTEYGDRIVEVGNGKHLRRIDAAFPFGSASAVALMEDVPAYKAVLRAHGLAVLPAQQVEDDAAAMAFAEAVGYPVCGWSAARGSGRTILYQAANAEQLRTHQAGVGRSGSHIIERVASHGCCRVTVWKGSATPIPSTAHDNASPATWPYSPSRCLLSTADVDAIRVAESACRALEIGSATVTLGRVK